MSVAARSEARVGIALAGAAQLLLCLVVLALPLLVKSSYLLFIATQLGVYVIVAIGLNFLAGYAGQVSLGHGALVAIGAYTTAILTVDQMWSFWPAALAAMVLTAAAGALMALPAFRLSTWYFALITLAFAQVVEQLIVEWRGLTKGFAGIVGVPSPTLFGFDFTPSHLYWLVAVTAILVFIGIRNVVRSRFGRALVAVRDTPAAALASGASLVRLKMFAFVVAAALAGLAGAFFAVQKTVVTPDDFTADFSIFFLLTIVLGGQGTLWGPVVGALVFFLIPELLSSLQSWRLMIYGAILLALMLFAPHGLVGAVRDLWARLATRAAGGRSESAPPARAARAEAAPVAGAALEVEGARKRFGGVVALDGVSMTAEAGTCHAIVGPNGSGKTTLLNVVGGYYSLDEGRVVIGGEEVAGRPAHAIAALGVGRTFQTPRLLAGLTVLDNVMLGAFTSERATAGEIALTLPRARREDARLRATALDYLDFVGLGSRAGDLAGEVPHGQQRLVEIARALVGRPRLLLLDEPAAGLSMSELDRLDQLIHSIRRLGSTVVIVEHHLDLVASIASRVTVLDRGAVLADDAPQAIFSNEAVLRAYMGDRALAKERVS